MKKCEKLAKRCNFSQFFFHWRNFEKIHLHSYFVIFYLKESVHNCARREIKKCSNDLNDNGLERQGLGAYFEPYSSIISWVINSLHFVKMMECRIFSKKSSHIIIFCDFFSKQLFTNGRVETSIMVQMIWIVVRWKKEVLAHLLSYTVDFQVVWTLFLYVFKVYPW